MESWSGTFSIDNDKLNEFFETIKSMGHFNEDFKEDKEDQEQKEEETNFWNELEGDDVVTREQKYFAMMAIMNLIANGVEVHLERLNDEPWNIGMSIKDCNPELFVFVMFKMLDAYNELKGIGNGNHV